MTRLRYLCAIVVAVAILPSACFEVPEGDVYFSCEPDARDECPPDYTCQADGCCHRNGSDAEASWNACRLSGNTGTSSAVTSSDTTSTSGMTSSSADTSVTPTDSGESSGAETGT